MFLFIAIVVILLTDIYTYKGLLILVDLFPVKWLSVFKISYWITSFVLYSGLIFSVFNTELFKHPKFSHYMMLFIGFSFIVLLPKLFFSVFHLVDDLVFLARKLFSYIGKQGNDGEKISRGTFLTKLALTAAAVPFISIAYGIIKGRYNFRVINEKIGFINLPKSFNGIKIGVISDVHLGSFGPGNENVKKGIDLLNSLKPDIVFFTGDLVNNYSEETETWLETFSSIQSKHGVFSVLGNHDYGDYVYWNSEEEKKQNLEKLKEFHKKAGFNLLLNSSGTIEINNEKITIVGVENWGLPPFKQYGDLDKALSGCNENCFKILLSHDPSHWDAKVLRKKNIPLTFSGHTHGMQFGVEIAGIKWSPAKIKYPRWGGLYSSNNQYLYVNRGFGFLGFPGRVGMPPEITLVELLTV
jgi:uncharacterized protein